ncbi:MAG: adenylate/guanylate cyclase domain-containing protein [Jaaginema sp. PMC 1079.18]|nr:adenylate/guanylate cyclase domain-containing protein [Jaaginema sp. PMC 1080.18]MEC4849679.1 adenylate/guanylate cyclase domain-containing protein [Jaaginema sp. PMC 1079.18]MEC4866162.1 adenylate/guanylate cyclase domain-containing protein [Jaaginema sp. PMC 1078.18]
MPKPVVLCVDDELFILDSLKRLLRKAIGKEYLIEVAQSGEEAIELTQELIQEGHEIYAIVADYIMPKMRGDELLRKLHEISPKTIKIMLTGQADIEAVGNAIKYANLYRYIAKPWQNDDLGLTVKEAINSYVQSQKLAEQTQQLQAMNQQLMALNQEQATLIAQLNENKSRLQQLLDGVPVGILVVDCRGQPYFLNARAEVLLNQNSEMVAAKTDWRNCFPFYQANSETPYPLEKDPIARALQGLSTKIDDIEIHQGEIVIPLEMWGTPIYDRQGEIQSAIVTFQDIRDRKLAEAKQQRFTAELRELNQAFERFVPQEFLQFLNRESIIEVQLGDQVQREVSVLFADIRDFTALSEQMTPAQNFAFINNYLSHMEPAIVSNRGFIDKYIGDAIMALFGQSADDAVQAGIDMLYQLKVYNQTLIKNNIPPIDIGIGINTGELILGTVGGQSRMDSTAIGDAVNLASRLENLNKIYNAPLLISQHTFTRLGHVDNYCIRLIDRVKVKGKIEMVSMFEVFDADSPDVKAGKLATRTLFEQALLMYSLKSLGSAYKLFQRCQEINPGDRIVQIYLERCRVS